MSNNRPTESCFTNRVSEYGHDELKNKLATGVAWALGGRAATVLLSIFMGALLARLLSPTDLGIYFLLFSIVAVFMTIAQQGFGRTAIRLIADALARDDNNSAKGVVLVAMKVGVTSSFVLAMAFSTGLGGWVANNIVNSLVLIDYVNYVAIWIALIMVLSLIAEIYRGYHDIRNATIFSGLIVNALVVLQLGYNWFVHPGRLTVQHVLVVTTVAVLCGAILASWKLRKRLSKITACKSVSQRQFLHESWPLLMSTVFLVVIAQADIWILGRYLANEDVAIYGASVRVTMLISTPLLIVDAVIPPLIAEMHANQNTKVLERMLRTITTFAGIPAVIVVLALVLFGEQILEQLYGEYYRTGAPVLIILSVGTIASIVVGPVASTLVMTGRRHMMMSITMAAGIVTIVASLLLVKQYGAQGVAMATATGLSMQSLGLWLATRLSIGISTHMGMVRLRYLMDVWGSLKLR